MAIELYRNPDGSVGGLDAGKVMVAPTQEEFDECCCGPCVFCADPNGGGPNPQPSLVISIDGGENANCLAGAVTYPWYRWDDSPWHPSCEWAWLRSYSEYIEITYCILTGRTFAFLVFGESIIFGGFVPPDCWEIYWAHVWKEITGFVTCNKSTGKLSGAFDLDGLGACVGYTAHVTLGG